MWCGIRVVPDLLAKPGFSGNTRRAIDLFRGDAVDESAFKDLIRATVALNRS